MLRVITDGWKMVRHPETINKLSPLFEKYGVNMVFSGHEHTLELLQNPASIILSAEIWRKARRSRQYISPESIWYAATNMRL